jgi:hypothetical protein
VQDGVIACIANLKVYSTEMASIRYCRQYIELKTEQEDGQLFVKAICPVCGSEEDSADHGYGEEHARRITVGKIKAHFLLSHGLKEDGKYLVFLNFLALSPPSSEFWRKNAGKIGVAVDDVHLDVIVGAYVKEPDGTYRPFHLCAMEGPDISTEDGIKEYRRVEALVAEAVNALQSGT